MSRAIGRSIHARRAAMELQEQVMGEINPLMFKQGTREPRRPGMSWHGKGLGGEFGPEHGDKAADGVGMRWRGRDYLHGDKAADGVGVSANALRYAEESLGIGREAVADIFVMPRTPWGSLLSPRSRPSRQSLVRRTAGLG
jgi:hypothetical protein